MELSNQFDLRVEHSDAKKITIDDIIECVFGEKVSVVAESFARNERKKEVG
ncbi:MAG: hypothetical protein ACI4S0_10455 [Dorea sp.]